jgi:hypothetical protein
MDIYKIFLNYSFTIVPYLLHTMSEAGKIKVGLHSVAYAPSLSIHRIERREKKKETRNRKRQTETKGEKMEREK